MKVDEKGNNVTLKDTKGNFKAFQDNVLAAYSSYEDKNLIIDLSNDGSLTLSQILSWLELSNNHRSKKRSFVLVVDDFNFDDAPEEMVVVPTLLEAHDIIQMEEIERDLGF